jgi:hypothetical protein
MAEITPATDEQVEWMRAPALERGRTFAPVDVARLLARLDAAEARVRVLTEALRKIVERTDDEHDEANHIARAALDTGGPHG